MTRERGRASWEGAGGCRGAGASEGGDDLSPLDLNARKVLPVRTFTLDGAPMARTSQDPPRFPKPDAGAGQMWSVPDPLEPGIAQQGGK